MSIKTCFFFISLVCVNAAYAQTLYKAQIDSLINVVSGKGEAMFSIAISVDGKNIYQNAVGYSDLQTNHKIKATATTCYRIGSVSKTFTSVIIFQLIEEGKLQLITPLSAYFADIPNASNITIANLLNHSSGLHNFTDDIGYKTILDKKVTKATMLKIFKNNKPDFEPGAKHQYSNTNFIILGYIIEALEDELYQEVLKKRICRKIGLTHTYYGGKINIAENEARSYKWQNKWVPDTETDMSIPGGAGAIVSTPSDMNTFITALFAGRFITDSSLIHMTTIVDDYGMGLLAYTTKDKVAYGHRGGIDGFQSLAIYVPEYHLAISYTANAVNTSLTKMIFNLLSFYADNSNNFSKK